MEFIGINDPRTESGDFGNYECGNCDRKSTAYLKIKITTRTSIVLCKGCLLDGADIINNTMIEDCILKGKT